ncbi:SpaH/EbpB family LPXTG-anchored major pilin [Cellulosimicrobium cellulans]|uniref:SpaH/EbpB family LPXTG-anchored major pilin n=1 Tax=Cellulosimicrobium cellulans TaxID=1710 RepID=UPI003646E959
MTTHVRRGLRVALAATAGAALLGIALGGPAVAADSLPDGSRNGTLTMHKYEEPDAATGLANDGTPLSGAQLDGLTAMPGVEFRVQKVPGIDLTTNAGWQAAAALDIASASTSTAAVAGQVGTTGSDGSATFDLPLGLYLVTETVYPDGTQPSAPFLVTLPLTDPDGRASWLYDVHVYPKNVVSGASKTVDDDAGTTLGDTITWTITGDIPNGGPTDAYRVVDPLDARLDYVGTRVSVTDGTALEVGTHYTVTHDRATNTVTLEFTPTGLALLAERPAAQVKVEIETTVNAIGEISNTAALYPNEHTIDTGNPVVTPSVQTKFGNLTAKKVDVAGTVLPGAQFKIYPTLDDAKADTNAITIAGTSVWTSDDNGLLTISGLRYSNFEDGQAIADEASWQHYYLAEVAAPAGYELLAEPIKVDVISGDTAVDLNITNVEANGGFTLPLTGGDGTTLIIVAGALLVTGAGVLALRSRYQKSATQS